MKQKHSNGSAPLAASTAYNRTAIALHWLMAVPIIILLIFGLQTMGSHRGEFLAMLHATAGFLLLGLVAFRIFWRFKYPPPSLPTSMSMIERVLARLTHIGFYAAMVLLPVTGWFAYTEHVRRTVAMGMGSRPASLFGLWDIPQLQDFGINFHFIHKWGGKAVLALIAVHILAALKHHFWDRDDVLKRIVNSGAGRKA